MVVHAIAEMAEGARRAGDRFFVQQPAREGVVAQPHGRAFAFQNLNVLRRSGARDRQPDRVRSGVNRRQLDGGGHS